MEMTRKAFHANNTRILCAGFLLGAFIGLLFGIGLS